jgi:tRNA nucleotidyltransferase (CCA-adding enzyme)
MKIYAVGGAVRDKILGLKPKDFDYLIFDSSPEEMIRHGFFQVGISFPIFIHPKTKHEYAFPRGSTLEEDLSRRDLTINSMALDENENLIDPHGGAKDLENKILRHTSSAFAEDPFRVYRLFRFQARFPHFTVAPETLDLARGIVKTSEFKDLSPERLIKELGIVLSLPKPSIFFEGLKSIGALSVFFPELEALIDVPQSEKYHPEGDAWIHTMMVLDCASDLSSDLLVRYAALVHDLGKGITPKEILPRHLGHETSGMELVEEMGERISAPNDWTEAALVVTRFHLRVHRLEEMKASSIVRMFYEMDAFRKPHLVEILSLACKADEMGKLKDQGAAADLLSLYFGSIKNISFKDLKPGLEGKAIGEEIRAERVRVLKTFIHQKMPKT